MPLNLIKIYDICRENDTLPGQLQKWGLVPKEGEFLCPKCDDPMKLLYFQNQGWCWDCQSKNQLENKLQKDATSEFLCVEKLFSIKVI